MKHKFKFSHSVSIAALCLIGSIAASAQPGCFQSVAAALEGAGTEDAAGFRVEGVTRNFSDGLTWARVRSCSHPEWPLRLVRAKVGVPLLQPVTLPVPAQTVLIMRAGSPVTLLCLGESVRMQVAGVAIEGGAVGQRVRVRVAGEGEERLIAGIVLSQDTLEMVR